MTDYLFMEPDTHQERLDRQGYVMQRLAKGNPVSMASVIWAQLGEKFRPPIGYKVFAMISTARGSLEIHGPFRNAYAASEWVNGCDFDSMIFALSEKEALEWGETDDKYVLVRIVGNKHL